MLSRSLPPLLGDMDISALKLGKASKEMSFRLKKKVKNLLSKPLNWMITRFVEIANKCGGFIFLSSKSIVPFAGIPT